MIELDICTPQGKTWLARITGHGKWGFDRVFVDCTEKATSRSGRTGTATYHVTDGVYQSNEGRFGRRFWLVSDGIVTEVDSIEVYL